MIKTGDVVAFMSDEGIIQGYLVKDDYGHASNVCVIERICNHYLKLTFTCKKDELKVLF